MRILLNGEVAQRLDSLLLRFLGLKRPRITSGAALNIGSAVRVAKMELVAH